MGFIDRLRNGNNQQEINNGDADFKNETTKKLPASVYYVESNEDGTVLVGMKVTIRRISNNYFVVSWWDPTHERCMSADEINYEGDNFSFKRISEEGGQTYYFSPMTLEIYNTRVKDRLLGKREFDNEEEMIKAFLEE
jgi:hypothetical protein